ncbi:unnamed protein product [Ectocarpus sp. 12 AP-2014]
MSVFIIGILSICSLVSGEFLDCSALAGADLQGFTGRGLSVYADDYSACIVDISFGDCIALFQGDGRDPSLVSRVFTFDLVTYVYREYWREVPGDVAFSMATEYDFGEHLNISACSIVTASYSMEASGLVNCSDVREFLVDEYDDDHSFKMTVFLAVMVYVCVVLLASLVFFVCGMLICPP